MKALPTLGKFIYSIPMMIFGLFHFMGAKGMTGMIPSYIPGGVFWVYLTGVALIAAGLGILIGKKGRLAAQLLGLMLVLFALMIHLPGATSGDQAATAMFLKDIALGGGAWVLSGQLRS
ncbi:DoxX family membrane protein [Reichenbachiella sp. MSK19-1]|uniref:DoxX family membrane protein n=1 Tax=Reichenbachiella sp. MSK19-1 TaxID=1897631 RepID=UPI000E6D50D2|nr:DoxX family membrane protein [Reichenbachiella sp. MSK19-1]RJE75142.1 DoxX family protein [Reichenbachiella sp. MSK19-1]